MFILDIRKKIQSCLFLSYLSLRSIYVDWWEPQLPNLQTPLLPTAVVARCVVIHTIPPIILQ